MVTLSGKKILLGITGSIAAVKSLQVLRDLREEGAQVKVVLSASASQFVPPLPLEVFSGHPVYSNLFEPGDPMLHLTLGDEADLVLVSPCTAHFLSKIAHGFADDLLSTLLLNIRGALLLAPAMDGRMWEHPTVQHHVAILKERGVFFIGPVSGLLASGKTGMGRMAEPSEIVGQARSLLLGGPEDLKNEVVLVTAGPTQEPIDRVRYITNRSSGKMGYAMADRARLRKARVLLVSGPTSLPVPQGVTFYSVRTSKEMEEATLRCLSEATIVIMTAAVSDYRVKTPFLGKIKKQKSPSVQLEMVETEDILKKVCASKKGVFVVGFAAETERLEENAKKKLVEKGVDLIVANDVGQEGIGMESHENEVTLFGKNGYFSKIPRSPKTEVADRIWDAIGKMR